MQARDALNFYVDYKLNYVTGLSFFEDVYAPNNCQSALEEANE